MTGPDHWSHSGLSLYQKCPKSWYAKYVEGIPSRPGVALVKGKSVDKIATLNWSNKKATGADYPISEIDDMAEAAFRASVTEVGGRDEVDWGRDNFTGALTSTQKLARVHMVAHAPLLTPDAVQVRVTRPIEGSKRTFLGFIDALGDEAGNFDVIDVKSGARKLSKSDADMDGQATAYAYALDRPIDFTFLRVIDTGKSPVQAERVDTHRGTQAIEWYAELLSQADRGVEAGVFPACPGWHCNWCPLHESCIGRLAL